MTGTGGYWIKFTWNAEPFVFRRWNTTSFTCAERREVSSASSPNSTWSGTCTATRYRVTPVMLTLLCQGWPQLKRPPDVAHKSFSGPRAVLWERCCKLWTSQCLEGPPTYLTFLTFIRAVRWHEMYVHIVTIYSKMARHFPVSRLSCPSYEFSFMSLVLEGRVTSLSAATGSNDKPVSCWSADGLSLSGQLPQNCASKSEQTDFPCWSTNGRFEEKTKTSLRFWPSPWAFSLCVCRGRGRMQGHVQKHHDLGKDLVVSSNFLCNALH